MEMGKKFTLDMQLREVIGKKVKRLRRDGIIPATVYGKGVGPFSVQIDERAFAKTYREIGRTTLVELNIPGQPRQAAFIHAIQRHPISRNILHADFHVVNLREKMTVEVPVMLVGKSPVAELGDAVINQVHATLAVEALPSDLPPHITLDLSGLTSLDKTLHVSDLPTSPTYTILADPGELLVALTPTRSAKTGEEAEAEQRPSSAEPELIREDRSRDEE